MITNKTGIGGTLRYIKNLTTGQVVWTNKHNSIVNQGLRLVIAPSDSKLVTDSQIFAKNNTTSTVANCILKASMLTSTTSTDSAFNTSISSNMGLCALCACGKSDVVTANDMTELQEFVGTLNDASAYGDMQSATLVFNNPHSTTFQFAYKYTAPEDFTCKEVGFYSLIPDTVSLVSDYLYFKNYKKQLFSRIVLDEPIEMVSGNVYSFAYDLDYTTASITANEETELFGLPSVHQATYTSSAPTGTSSINMDYLPRFTDTGKTMLFKDASDARNCPYSSIYWHGRNMCLLNTNVTSLTQTNVSTSTDTNVVIGCFGLPHLGFRQSANFNVNPCTPYANSICSPYFYSESYNNTFPFTCTRQSKVKLVPDEVTDTSSMTTYTWEVPYTNTSDTYAILIYGRERWLLNATLDGTDINQSALGIDNMHRFSVTFKTSVERI